MYHGRITDGADTGRPRNRKRHRPESRHERDCLFSLTSLARVVGLSLKRGESVQHFCYCRSELPPVLSLRQLTQEVDPPPTSFQFRSPLLGGLFLGETHDAALVFRVTFLLLERCFPYVYIRTVLFCLSLSPFFLELLVDNYY